MTGNELEEWMAKVDAQLEDLTRRVNGLSKDNAEHEREFRRVKRDLERVVRDVRSL
jgi:archaellum component FlaC